MIFTCDTSGISTEFSHFWKHTVGSDHAVIALRADWEQQLRRCHTELGFKCLRFHGILSDDMGTLVYDSNELIYSFFNTDQVFDFLLSIGMRPFVELSFMPTAIASGPDVFFHYKGNVTPPRDYGEWATLIHKLVAHWVDRYGIEEVSNWFFEVWNEPNISDFWKGTQADYFKLYQYTAEAIKKVDTSLQVGGPATANNGWITEFINFCTDNKVPVDFISTHHYPTDGFGEPGDDTLTLLSKSRRSVLRDAVIHTRSQAGSLPVYYTEWNTSADPFDELHDMPYAAAYIIKTVMEAQGMVEGYSYWVCSDIFEENYLSSIPFHGGFGLLNIYGIPKPAYRAFQLLGDMGSHALPVSGTHDTVDVWITKKEGFLKILITNTALPSHPIKTEQVEIQLYGIDHIISAGIERIDEDHANARKAWVNMGMPGSLLPAQVKVLEQASEMVKEPFEIIGNNSTILLVAEIPPQGTACITLEIA